MGPFALFDKSFLQSLTIDESLWFDHFFSPVVCPMFYVETLADLSKEVGTGNTPEREVARISEKFPEMRSYPCPHHATVGIQNLLGATIPMDGRIPRFGGKQVELDGKVGIVYENSPEAEAFSRWQSGRFLDVEHTFARVWRASLQQLDLEATAKALRELGIDGKACRRLQDVKALADSIVSGTSHKFQRMELAIRTANTPREAHQEIVRRWSMKGCPPIATYAPYAAHLLSVEMFLQFALASHLIGTERSSNCADFAYLNYLPFSMIFVSSDKLHRRCAPFFLRDDQEFVWGYDLKADLARINAHFAAFPEAEKERGLSAFAAAPPKLENSLVRRLRARYLVPGYDDRSTPPPPRPEDMQRNQKLIDEINKWAEAATAGKGHARGLVSEPDTMTIERQVRKRKGSYWQLPKDLQVEPEDAD